MKKLLSLILLCLFFSLGNVALAEDNKIDVVIFTQTGCQYCAKTLAYLDELKKGAYPSIVVKEYDIRKEPAAYSIFKNYQQAYGDSADGTPVTFIGNKMIKGALLPEIDAALATCKQQQCINPADIVATYVKDNPTAEQKKSNDKTIIGWIIIGVVVAGGGILLLSRN